MNTTTKQLSFNVKSLIGKGRKKQQDVQGDIAEECEKNLYSEKNSYYSSTTPEDFSSSYSSEEDDHSRQSDQIKPQNRQHNSVVPTRKVELFGRWKKASQIIDDGTGFYYKKGNSSALRTYLLCINSSCEGRGFTKAPLRNGDILCLTCPHNHAPDFDFGKLLLLKRNILERCEHETDTSMKTIFYEECAKFPKKIAKKINFEEMRTAMYYKRNKGKDLENSKNLPENSERHIRLLNGPAQFVGFVRGKSSSTRLAYDSYGYKFYPEYNSYMTRIFFRCIVRTCKGRGASDFPISKGAIITETYPHNHFPNLSSTTPEELNEKTKQRPDLEIILASTSDEEDLKLEEEIVRNTDTQKIKTSEYKIIKSEDKSVELPLDILCEKCKPALVEKGIIKNESVDSLIQLKSIVQTKEVEVQTKESSFATKETASQNGECVPQNKNLNILTKKDKLFFRHDPKAACYITKFLNSRLKSFQIVFDSHGYFYHILKKLNKKAFLKCTFKKCQGRAFVPLPIRDGIRVTETRLHCHPPDFNRLGVLLLKRRIIRRCILETSSFSTIWDEETARVPKEVSKSVSRESIEQVCWKKRKKTKTYFEPESLQQIEESVDQNQIIGPGLDSHHKESSYVVKKCNVRVLPIAEGGKIKEVHQSYHTESCLSEISQLKEIEQKNELKKPPLIQSRFTDMVSESFSTMSDTHEDNDQLLNYSTLHSDRSFINGGDCDDLAKTIDHQIEDSIDKIEISDPVLLLEVSEPSRIMKILNEQKSSIKFVDSRGYYYNVYLKKLKQAFSKCIIEDCPGLAQFRLPIKEGETILIETKHHTHSPGQSIHQEIQVMETKHFSTCLEETSSIQKHEDFLLDKTESDIQEKRQNAQTLCSPNESCGGIENVSESKSPPQIIKIFSGKSVSSVTVCTSDGYFYHSHSHKNNPSTTYLRCILRCGKTKCKGRAKTVTFANVGAKIINTNPHNHKKDSTYLPFLELKKSLYDRCISEMTPYQTIWNEETARYPKEVYQRVKFKSLKTWMLRKRQKAFQCKYKVKREAKGKGGPKPFNWFEDPEKCRKVQVFPGQRTSTFMIYDGVGYYYERVNVGLTYIYMRCIKRDCGARVVSQKPCVEGCLIRETQPHNHPPDNSLLPVWQLKKRIVERSQNESTPFLVIYEEECSKSPKNVVAKLKLPGPSRTMTKKSLEKELGSRNLRSLEGDGEVSENDVEFTNHDQGSVAENIELIEECSNFSERSVVFSEDTKYNQDSVAESTELIEVYCTLSERSVDFSEDNDTSIDEIDAVVNKDFKRRRVEHLGEDNKGQLLYENQVENQNFVDGDFEENIDFENVDWYRISRAKEEEPIDSNYSVIDQSDLEVEFVDSSEMFSNLIT